MMVDVTGTRYSNQTICLGVICLIKYYAILIFREADWSTHYSENYVSETLASFLNTTLIMKTPRGREMFCLHSRSGLKSVKSEQAMMDVYLMKIMAGYSKPSNNV